MPDHGQESAGLVCGRARGRRTTSLRCPRVHLVSRTGRALGDTRRPLNKEHVRDELPSLDLTFRRAANQRVSARHTGKHKRQARLENRA